MATKKQARSEQNQRGRYRAGGTTESYPDRLGWWERKVFPKSATDITITVTPRYAGRPDLLSFDLYGTTSLIWMVLQYNSIIDINTEFITGSVLTLPTKTRLYTQLLSNT